MNLNKEHDYDNEISRLMQSLKLHNIKTSSFRK